ncbi:MAG: hypothetical protein Q8R25_01685 [bacterium]|nr:hypothetical protein [bacterium]
MYKVSMRSVAGLLVGVLMCIFSTSAEARRTPIKETPEERQARYEKCVVVSKAIETAYYLEIGPGPFGSYALLDTDEYLFRVYLRTVKWDGGCFEWKDPLAATKINKTLKEYVIGGVHPVWKERVRKLFVALEEKECSEGVKCKPGITSGFRDNFRQDIAEGFKASTCRSNHGGSCVTKGWGDGRAFDVVNVSDFDVIDVRRWKASDTMWRYIDDLGRQFGISRPMPDRDPMHIQPRGSLASHVFLNKENDIEKVVTAKVKKKHIAKKKKKKKKARKKRSRDDDDD